MLVSSLSVEVSQWGTELADNILDMEIYSETIMTAKSPASRLFTQPLIQAQIKENIKALRHWPLLGEFTGDRQISRTQCQ